MKEIFIQWAMNAAIAWFREHGDELLEQVKQWIAEQLDKLQENPQIYSATPPPAGCEAFCQEQAAKLSELTNAA